MASETPTERVLMYFHKITVADSSDQFVGNDAPYVILHASLPDAHSRCVDILRFRSLTMEQIRLIIGISNEEISIFIPF